MASTHTTPAQVRVAIGLGSSLGDRIRRLEDTVRCLDRAPLRLLRVSPWVRTPPMEGGHARNWFLNGVALFAAPKGIDPHALLDVLVGHEVRNGRRRAHHWGDRPLDLDLLLVEGLSLRSERLTLPHPGIAHRRFVLEPLLGLWPDAVDPNTGVAYASVPSARGPCPAVVGHLAPARRLRYL